MINEPPFVNDFGRPSRFMLVLRPLASMIRGIVRLRPPRRVIHIESNDGNHTRELKRRGCLRRCIYRALDSDVEYAYGGITESSA
jgi:hypothetical protein